jgi:hypothetical protein
MDGPAIAAILIGLGATVAAMAMPFQYPNAPGWAIELAWWGGLALIAIGFLYLLVKWLRQRPPRLAGSASSQDRSRREPTLELHPDTWVPIADAIQRISQAIGDTAVTPIRCWRSAMRRTTGESR